MRYIDRASRWHRELIAAFTTAAIQVDQDMSTIAAEFTPQAHLKRSVEDWNRLMQRLEVHRVHEAQKKLGQWNKWMQDKVDETNKRIQDELKRRQEEEQKISDIFMTVGFFVGLGSAFTVGVSAPTIAAGT
jgi:hypothetical protein